MADNDTDQTRHAEKGHEAEGGVHDGQRNQRSDRPVGGCGKDEKWLDGVVELDEKGEVDAYERDQEHNSKIEETIDLFCLFARDLELVSRRQVLLEGLQFRLCRAEHFGGEDARCWKAEDGDGAEVFAAPNPPSLEDVAYGGDGE